MSSNNQNLNKPKKERKPPELFSFTNHIHYIPNYTNVGILTLSNGDSYFIDVGASESAALDNWNALKKVFPNTNLKAIIVTHSHSDHVGGNDALLKVAPCEIWASKIDGYLLEMAVVMPALISNGRPVEETENDYYFSKSKTPSSRTIDVNETIFLGGKDENDSELKLTFLHLPGHWFSQIGVIVEDLTVKGNNGENGTPRKILFAGDAIYGRSEVKKYWIAYTFNQDDFIESLNKIAECDCDIIIPSHGNVISKDIINENIELNMLQIIETEKMILSFLDTPKSFEQILKHILDKNSIHPKVNQVYLIGSTIRSLLSCLQHRKLIYQEVEDNILYWKLVK